MKKTILKCLYECCVCVCVFASVCSITRTEWRRGSPGAGSVSGENEDREGEEEQASFKWKWVRGVNKNRQNGSEMLAVGSAQVCLALVCPWVCTCMCMPMYTLSRFKEHVPSCVFPVENIGENRVWEKRGKKKIEGPESHERSGGLPDTEVCAPGVVSTNGGDSARVRAYVAWPGLGDVEGAICIQSHARNGLNVDNCSLFLPDMPGTQSHQSVGIFIPSTVPFKHTQSLVAQNSRFLKRNYSYLSVLV